MTRVKALKDAGYSKEDAKRIMEILDNNVQIDISKQEKLYEDIVSWALDATANNAAFTEEYGFWTLNNLRFMLGLPLMKKEG